MAGFEARQPAEAKDQPEGYFGFVSNFVSYVAKPEITAIAPNFLVKKSKNMWIDFAQRVISRPGYMLYDQANTSAGPIKGSYEWDTSTGQQFSLRSYDHNLEFDYGGLYNTLMTSLQDADVEFATVNDLIEQQDVLLFVNGEPNYRRWSGGVTKIRKATATSITKQGLLGPTFMGYATISLASPGVVTLTGHGLSVGNPMSFKTTSSLPSPLSPGVTYYVQNVIDANNFNIALTNGGAAINTAGIPVVSISPSGGGFYVNVPNYAQYGITSGQPVVFADSGGSMPGPLSTGTPYYVKPLVGDLNNFSLSSTPGGNVVAPTTGAASGTITIVQSIANSIQLNNVGDSLSIAFVASTSPGTIAATITDANSNFLNAGFMAGDTLSVIGSVNNSGKFTIAAVTAGTLTLVMSNTLVTELAGAGTITLHTGEPTWETARFFSVNNSRAVLFGGVPYTYSGGETTDTLIGLTAFPFGSVTVGEMICQAIDTLPLPNAIAGPFPTFTPDLIGSQLNAVYLASSQSGMVFGSSVSDYTNFSLTAPRAPGDPVQQPLSNGFASCIIPTDTDRMILNIQSSLIFGSGRDAFDQLDFHMSSDNTEELARLIRYKTALGAGLIGKSAYSPIKQNTVYISREPALDWLSEANLEQQDSGKNIPLSDPIKNDFDSYDFTDAHVKYWKRAIWIAVPREGLVLMYDLMRGLWQPPFTIPIGRLAIIDDWLYGHSSITNETYKLWAGTTDNGNPIIQVARFAYNNGGRRDRLKDMGEHWTDGYISANGLIQKKLYYGFDGALGIKSFTIEGNDKAVVTSLKGAPLGNEPLGFDPLGGSFINSPQGLEGGPSLLRFQQINTMTMADYFEYFSEYTMTTPGGQFAIVADGSNQWDAGTSANSYKK